METCAFDHDLWLLENILYLYISEHDYTLLILSFLSGLDFVGRAVICLETGCIHDASFCLGIASSQFWLKNTEQQ